jgi:serine/threonine protein phosphatase PrpC
MPEVQTSPRALQPKGWSAQHCGDRTEQQDRIAILVHPRARGVALAVVADGVAGSSGGALAAEQVVSTAARCFAEFAPGADDPGEFFRALVAELDTALWVAGVIGGLQPRSTMAAVLILPGSVAWCHVGDSRIYHQRGRRIRQLTADQTAFIGNSCMVAALGAGTAPRVAPGQMRSPRPGDTFVLCTDGIWNHVEAREIASCVAVLPARAVADHLIGLSRARARGHCDNCSVVVVRLEPSDGEGFTPARARLPDAAAARSLAIGL